MGRTGSTYKARLQSLMNQCLQLYLENGYIDPVMLAEREELSSRMLRDYLNDLLHLQILKYVGNNRYVLNTQLFRTLGDEELEWIRSPVLSVDSLAASTKFFDALSEVDNLQEKIQSIYEKMKLLYVFPEELRKTLSTEPLDANLMKKIEKRRIKNVIGKYLVEKNVIKALPLRDLLIVGSSAKYDSFNYKIGAGAAILTITILASAAYGQYFHKEPQKTEAFRPYVMQLPEIHRFEGYEPYGKDDPFYEMLHDFPELLYFGRSLAIRFLSNILQWQSNLELLKVLEKEGVPLKNSVWFFRGTLSPHGFVTMGKKLKTLQQKAHQLFYTFADKAREHGLYIVGVSAVPKDDIFFSLANHLLVKTGYIEEPLDKMSDNIFLNQVMHDKDVTCLIERTPELSKPSLEGTYEFFWKDYETLLKLEFISVEDDPLKERNYIASILSSAFTLKPFRGASSGPSATIQAEIIADSWHRQLQQYVMAAFELGWQKFFQEIKKSEKEKFTKKLNMKDLISLNHQKGEQP